MSSPWQPHGLIRRPELEHAYQEARLNKDGNGGFIVPKGHKTIRLFERLFRRIVFTEDRFFVNSQQPPTEDSSLVCNIVISAVDGAHEEDIFCFCEGETTKTTGAFEAVDAEDQARKYCNVHLDAHPEKARVYACTLVGTYIRCWVIDQENRVLHGMWDPKESGSASAYLDVGVEEHRPALEKAFDRLKSLSITTVGQI
ncbi:hypothetical protein ACRALDRAFT_1095286 [Sodiomyces alcalophilus JCM 7366]|uniref:uncharacterized protein n=1 Tax=Sodiomyces alcalophilus JCM 7366 TaxID=591952 RepID=UPI0039B6AF4F